jgi:hypothetical protein
MKRVYAVTSTSESPTLSSTDDSAVTSEFNASDAASSRYHSGKRQKPQVTLQQITFFSMKLWTQFYMFSNSL